MAWSAPRTWVALEVVTAALMNTHVRDNLKYLKGQAGTVAIESGIDVTGAVTATGAGTFGGSGFQMAANNTAAAFKGYYGVTGGTNIGIWDINRSPATGTFDDTAKSHARIGMDGNATASYIQFLTANAANTVASERMRITGAGLVGIGRTVPTGLLHGYNAISGFIHWEFDGIDGTARTVLADGAGDVLYTLAITWVIRASTGEVRCDQVSSTSFTPGTNLTLMTLNAGADVCQFQLNANGSVTVQRTAGSKTYKVGLWMLWI